MGQGDLASVARDQFTQYGSQATAQITPEQRRGLEDLAQRRQVSVAAIVREAIRDYLDRQSQLGAA
ncbi:MAG TPA: ribbon-helix-helix protein, CopG family [Chloroflexota bacterium]|jgi:predicted transcriptional regulator